MFDWTCCLCARRHPGTSWPVRGLLYDLCAKHRVRVRSPFSVGESAVPKAPRNLQDVGVRARGMPSAGEGGDLRNGGAKSHPCSAWRADPGRSRLLGRGLLPRSGWVARQVWPQRRHAVHGRRGRCRCGRVPANQFAEASWTPMYANSASGRATSVPRCSTRSLRRCPTALRLRSHGRYPRAGDLDESTPACSSVQDDQRAARSGRARALLARGHGPDQQGGRQPRRHHHHPRSRRPLSPAEHPGKHASRRPPGFEGPTSHGPTSSRCPGSTTRCEPSDRTWS